MPGGQAGGVHFRAGVVIVVRHPIHDLVMAFERATPPGQWQLPQGGIDQGETPLDAAWRELGEETGLRHGDVEYLDEFPEWLAYQWPPGVSPQKTRGGVRLGQVHRWFYFETRTVDVVPTPDGDEFVAWRWASTEWLIANVTEFRKANYARGLATLPVHPVG